MSYLDTTYFTEAFVCLPAYRDRLNELLTSAKPSNYTTMLKAES